MARGSGRRRRWTGLHHGRIELLSLAVHFGSIEEEAYLLPARSLSLVQEVLLPHDSDTAAYWSPLLPTPIAAKMQWDAIFSVSVCTLSFLAGRARAFA